MSIALAIGIGLAAIHIYFVAHIVRLILSGVEPDWPMYWLYLFYLDFPFSLLFALVAKARFLAKAKPLSLPWLRAPVHDLDNFVLPFLLLGIGGSVWWFLLPQIIARAID